MAVQEQEDYFRGDFRRHKKRWWQEKEVHAQGIIVLICALGWGLILCVAAEDGGVHRWIGYVGLCVVVALAILVFAIPRVLGAGGD